MKTYLVYFYRSIYGSCRFIGFAEAESEIDACNKLGIEIETGKNGKIYGLFRYPKGHIYYGICQDILFKELDEITTLEQISKILSEPHTS